MHTCSCVHGVQYTNPEARLCLARAWYRPVRYDIRRAYDMLVEDPKNVTIRDLDLMSMCIYGDRYDQWKERTIPGPPAGTPPLEYVYWLNPEVGNTTKPTTLEVQTAKKHLERYAPRNMKLLLRSLCSS